MQHVNFHLKKNIQRKTSIAINSTILFFDPIFSAKIVD